MIIENVLVFSHFIDGNRVFEDYCNGIKAHSKNYHYVDYIEEYLAQGKDQFEQRILQKVMDDKIDCIFFIWWSSDLTFDLKFMEKLASLTAIVINYYDTEYFFEGVDRYYAQLADLVILPDCLARYKYEHLNINALTTFALYDKNLCTRDEKLPKAIDVSFVGNLKQANRKEYIDYLTEHGISVQTYGVASNNGFVTFDEMIKVFNQSKINLNFTGTSNSGNYVVRPPTINQRIKQSKGRPIEIALSGGFILSEYAPGISEMFSLGEEMEVFASKEDLLDKVQFYLANEDKRIDAATRSYRRAIQDYDCVSGFRRVFNKLAEVDRSSNKTSHVDRSFLENFTSYRFFYIALFLLKGNFGHIPAEISTLFKYRAINFSKCYHFSVKGFLYYMRAHPQFEAPLKLIKNKLRITVRY